MINLNGAIKLFLCSYFIFLQVSVATADKDGRIVGGESTTIAKFKFLLQLKDGDTLLCGATLITRIHAVTAAHCFKYKPQHLVVVGGATKLLDPGTCRSKVLKHIIHPAFTQGGYDMDVAVLRLETPMVGENIQPISLKCTQNWSPGQKVTLVGYGLTEYETEAVPIDLQTVDVKVIDKETCSDAYMFRRNLTESMACAFAENKDSCNGDSGGPAIINKEYCGIVSYGISCADQDFPGVYTKVTHVSKFIKKCIKKMK